MSRDFPGPGPLLPRPPSRARDRLLVAGLLILLTIGLLGVSRGTDWAEIGRVAARLTLDNIALLLALSLLNYFLRAVRWQVFSRALRLQVPARTGLLHYFGGFAMSVTPGKIGELVRLRWLARAANAPVERAAPAALGDRAFDLAAMALLLSTALPFAIRIPGAPAIALLALGSAAAATHPRLLATLVGLAYRLSGRRFPRLTARLRRAALSLGAFGAPSVLIGALCLGLAGWLAEIWAFHLLLGWLGAEVGFATALAIFVFSTLAGGLTGAPGGLGGAEAAMVALITVAGVPLPAAIAATALIRFTTLWFAVLLGLMAFPFAERGGRTTGG
ncbi:lysylphosphatidylglycerol synthase transmembrane domain-containing protein [Frigidibacter sp. RF13]|uniref:lysylphosphatidylglycerol synthase transmembrane domain-containing protein n=1 Tax=Frigidibacter sp. RF13 TaxID=2997340 RepID=UPI00226FD435|nr:lysylphosphatidylglycerol synthase transmembrane domain-containing protein [Frigidibacter sp. RF13]